MVAKVDIEEIEKRAGAATDGPWIYGSLLEVDVCVDSDATGERVCTTMSDARQADAEPIEIAQADVNAEFIAHARTDVPALIVRVRELERERETLIEQVNDLNRQLVEWGEQAQREADADIGREFIERD
jgi:hypothetical protein